jgi:hypothetical protein
MKIACDQAVSQRAVMLLQAHGHDVVYHATDHELDSWWVKKAIACGAELFVSHDTDIICLADNFGLARIELPQRCKGEAQARFVLAELARG